VTDTASPHPTHTGRTGPVPERLGANYLKLFSASTISNLGDGIGVIAYPWLASAITRNPILISIVVVVQRLPWLVFSLPAGVITDRHDRRRLMVGANTIRAILTAMIAAAVLSRQGELPAPDVVSDAATVITTDTSLYLMILVATLLLGIAEVLYDNSAQTFLPSIVPVGQLEKANGRMWSFEVVANTFAGPPLAALLVAVSFSLPFFVDAATFAVSALLIALIRPSVRADRIRPATRPTSWRIELADGFRWLWSHDLLRTLAVTLGFLNLISTMQMATFVLFGQEVLGTSPTEFAILGTGAAVGGVIGGWTASSISRRIGPGPSLGITLVGGAVLSFLIGLSSWWPAVWFFLAVLIMIGTLWNVITVSFRQAVIPDHLLGRVNSVYRFFGWGMMPIGAALGGVIVVVADAFGSRELAQRMPWLVAGVASVVLFAVAAPRLTTEKFEAARASGHHDGEGYQHP
jgi:MFS family permease